MAAQLQQLKAIHTLIEEAAQAVDRDSGASPVLRAVVNEFRDKSKKASGASAEEAAVREAVIELEQAGDSAKVAAQADPGISEPARAAVLSAHDGICTLKAEL